LELLASQRLLSHLAFGAPPDVIEPRHLVVDRYDGEEKIPIWIRHETRRDESGHARLDAPPLRTLDVAQRDVMEAEVGQLRLDARRGIESHVLGLLGEVELRLAGLTEGRDVQDAQV